MIDTIEQLDTEHIETLPADGIYHVFTQHSQYTIDTAEKTAVRVNVAGNNALPFDGEPITYTHIECDIDAPLVLLWIKPGVGETWRVSTDVVGIVAA